ncbi:MAG: ATP-dependent DNA helicase Rep [Anaerolineae bacterium]|nr:ATP-dependent DNA helicase Rep [Anaerolineae bacterium]
MPWFITHKPAYDADFVDLPKDLQKQATQAHAELAQDPVTPRGNTIKKLKGWDNVWRYRLGDTRLIYSVVPESKVVQLLAIGPRGSVYQRFNYNPAAADQPPLTFSPELAAGLEPSQSAGPEWTQHPEWFQPKDAEPVGAPLPRKLTPAVLTQWRIPAEHHAALMPCLTEEALMQAEVPPDVLGRVMDALWPPPVEKIAAQPDQALFKPEDLEQYAAGNLRGFLLHLDDDQRKFADWALKGPTLVKGGPGSGKSTLALYRLRAIVEQARQAAAPPPDILLTTYTNALISVSESLLRQLLADPLNLNPRDNLPESIRVTTVDSTAMWIAKHSGQPFKVAGRDNQLEALHYARSTLQPKEIGDLDKLLVAAALHNLRDDYLLEEFDWVIEGQNCTAPADYLAANRAGRGIPFDEKLRAAVWQLYDAYRVWLQQQEYRTWGQIRQLALTEVRSGNFERRWEYVIVDEAQDLPPAALALCVELCRDPAGLFLTADANQSLYNRGFRWHNVHHQLKVAGRTRILKRNYRSTREIATAAAELLAPAGSADTEAVQQSFIHIGPPPAVYAAAGTSDQARWLAQQIWQAAQDLRLPINAAAVLVPSNSLGKTFADLLNDHGLPAKFMSGKSIKLEERCVKVMTLHSAKGLEFPIVALAHVEADRLPRESEATDAQDVAEHHEAQRRLMYVGCTRAMRYLFVTHDKSIPSPFLQQLTDNCWLWL